MSRQSALAKVRFPDDILLHVLLLHGLLLLPVALEYIGLL